VTTLRCSQIIYKRLWSAFTGTSVSVSTRFLHPHRTNPSFFRPFSTVRRLTAASAEALLHFVPVASDASASSGARGLHQKAAIGAVDNDGGKMRVLSITELMRLTRGELCGLETEIKMALAEHPEVSPERNIADRNLRSIRRVLAWYDLAPE
jgi:hypothetical protein